MKTRICLWFLLMIFPMNSIAQPGVSIVSEKKGLKRIYFLNGEKIDKKQLASVLISDPASVQKYKTSQAFHIAGLTSIACSAAFAGAGLYYSVKAARATNDNNLKTTTDYSNKSVGSTLLCVGFMIISVPFNILANSNLKKSINLYNKSHSAQGYAKAVMSVGVTDHGVGIQLRF